jgi:UDP-N-acetylmuramoyl-L-alanyl-D-glutamate--2,6-diaminopimelate ligase
VKEDIQPLIIVFGCGGDRDTEKRPQMARIAEKYADNIIVTSDNPRSEDPAGIIKDIEAGFSKSAVWESVTSRKEAIHKAITEAPINSIVLIAGKGHETYQEVNGEKYPFDDREIARKALDEINNHEKTGEGN